MRHHRPAKLPPPCPECRPFEGLWRRGLNGGLERCFCARADAIQAASPRRKRRKKHKAAHDGRAAGANDK